MFVESTEALWSVLLEAGEKDIGWFNITVSLFPLHRSRCILDRV